MGHDDVARCASRAGNQITTSACPVGLPASSRRSASSFGDREDDGGGVQGLNLRIEQSRRISDAVSTASKRDRGEFQRARSGVERVCRAAGRADDDGGIHHIGVNEGARRGHVARQVADAAVIMGDRDAINVVSRPWVIRGQDDVGGVNRSGFENSQDLVRISHIYDHIGEDREIRKDGAASQAVVTKFLVHDQNNLVRVGTQASTEQSRRNGVSGDFNVSARAVHATERAADRDVVIGGVRQLGVGDDQGGGCRRGIGSRIDRASSDFHPLIDQAAAVRHDRQADRATNDVRGVRGLGDNRRRGRSGTDDEVIDGVGTIGAAVAVVVNPHDVEVAASRPTAEINGRRDAAGGRSHLCELRQHGPASRFSGLAVVGMVTTDLRVFTREGVWQP